MIKLDNNLRFVSNFKYELKPNVTLDINDKRLYKDKHNFKSICNQTMIGFVQNLNVTGSMAEHEMTCFYAEKDQTQLYEDQVSGI